MATKTLYQHIEVTQGIAGGKPRIKGHRITVQNIVVWHEYLGQSIDEIAHSYDLSLASIYAALSYYHDHRQAIDDSIKEGEAFAQKLKQQTTSKLQQKLIRLGVLLKAYC